MVFITVTLKLTPSVKILLQVTSKKKRINHNLPVQIGFFVYSYAKLRMLEFFYDVIDRVISRDDYNLLEMDTGKDMINKLFLFIRNSIK